MRVVQAQPPLIDEIDAVFHVRGKPVLFAWGDRIFNPLGIPVPPELMAHEAVHGERQLGTAVAGTARGEDALRQWWHRYLTDPDFRLAEELPAHVAEFRSLCDQHRHKWHSERNMRRMLAAHVGRRLAAPLYGNLITETAAKRLILAA